MLKLKLPAVSSLEDEEVKTQRGSSRALDTTSESGEFSDGLSDFSGAAGYSMSPS